MKNKIILASKSPRRKEILRNLKISYEERNSNFDEEDLCATIEDPVLLVKTLAYEKAKGVISKTDEDFIYLGADTVVVYEGNILGKPRNELEAANFLSLLSGKMHYVYTGIALLRPALDQIFCDFEETKVFMRDLSKDEINDYIKTNEPMDKAGAYAIQGIGSVFIDRIDGDYFNVVGLPIPKLMEGFKRFNIHYFDQIISLD